MRGQVMWLLLLHGLLPLIPGTLVYLFLRSGNSLSAFLQERTGILPRLPAPGPLRLFANSFPDFCWSYSFTAALLIYGAFFSWSQRTALIFTGIVVVFSEAVQPLFADHFTFDYLDLIAVLAGFFLCRILLAKSIYAQKA